MTETENQAEDCPRCGSLLPDSDEGLCPTCGYEFGRATLYMPVVRLEHIDQGSDIPDAVFDAPGAAPSHDAASPTAPSAAVPIPPPMQIPAEDPSRKVLFIALGLILLFVVGLIGAAVILLYSTVDGDARGEGAVPSVVEQPVETTE